MNSKQMSLLVLVILLGASFSYGQEKKTKTFGNDDIANPSTSSRSSNPSNKPKAAKEGEASFDETMDFIKQKVSSFTYVLPTQKSEHYFKVTTDGSCTCKINENTFTRDIPERANGLSHFDFNYEFSLSDLQGNVEVSNDEKGYYVNLLTKDKKEVIKSSGKYTILKSGAGEKYSDENRWRLQIYMNNKEIAEKVGKAFSHAIVLCGGTENKDPF